MSQSLIDVINATKWIQVQLLGGPNTTPPLTAHLVTDVVETNILNGRIACKHGRILRLSLGTNIWSVPIGRGPFFVPGTLDQIEYAFSLHGRLVLTSRVPGDPTEVTVLFPEGDPEQEEIIANCTVNMINTLAECDAYYARLRAESRAREQNLANFLGGADTSDNDRADRLGRQRRRGPGWDDDA